MVAGRLVGVGIAATAGQRVSHRRSGVRVAASRWRSFPRAFRSVVAARAADTVVSATATTATDVFASQTFAAAAAADNVFATQTFAAAADNVFATQTFAAATAAAADVFATQTFADDDVFATQTFAAPVGRRPAGHSGGYTMGPSRPLPDDGGHRQPVGAERLDAGQRQKRQRRTPPPPPPQAAVCRRQESRFARHRHHRRRPGKNTVNTITL